MCNSRIQISALHELCEENEIKDMRVIEQFYLILLSDTKGNKDTKGDIYYFLCIHTCMLHVKIVLPAFILSP